MTSELTNRRQEPQLTSIETVELENGPSSSWRIELEKTLCSPPSNVRKKSYENFAGEDRGRQLLYPESPCGSEAPTAWNSQAPTAQNSRCNSLDRGENGESSKERAPIEYPEDAPYHIFSLKKKRCLMLLVSFTASLAPLSTNIFLPALDLIADKMDTDNSDFVWSVSVYIIAQGLAPSFWGPLADSFGRRQTLMYSMSFYIGANIGLGLSTNFPTLLVFRFLQAVGSSSTVSIGAGIIADIAPPAERGGLIGTFAGVRQFATAIGPVLGGVIVNTLDYHWIFWFLVILSFLAIFAVILFLPETLRSIAGNGSVRLMDFRHQPLYEKLCSKDQRPSSQLPHPRTKITWRAFVEPAACLLEKDVACTLFFGGVIFTVWSMVTASTSVLLSQNYHLNVLQIGFCFLPNGIGCIAGSITSGIQLDKDFRGAEELYRYRNGLSSSHSLSKKQLPDDFPLERARLAQLLTAVPTFVFGLLIYGFGTAPSTSLALPLLAQFIIGYSSTAILNLNNTLTIDLYPSKGASATAVNNLARCMLGAVGVSFTILALNKVGAKILFSILAAIVLLASTTAAAGWKYGMRWRAARVNRLQKASDEICKIQTEDSDRSERP